MLVKKVKKPSLWKGEYVSVREYEIENAIDQGGMIIHWQGKTMTLSKPNCETIYERGERDGFYKSKFGGRNYPLINIKWTPDNEIQSQETLF